MLNFDLTAISGNTRGYSYFYRVISEETGQEINGVITEITSSAIRERASGSAGYNIDVSALPDGKLVVIVQVKDPVGKVVAVRSAAVEKNGSTSIGKVLVTHSKDYYTLDGRKLQQKPSRKGVYIVDGKKVIVK